VSALCNFAYLPGLVVSDHLAPFALIPAFPDFVAGRYSGDYYGAPVTIGFASLR
jgi:hypothetical protein